MAAVVTVVAVTVDAGIGTCLLGRLGRPLCGDLLAQRRAHVGAAVALQARECRTHLVLGHAELLPKLRALVGLEVMRQASVLRERLGVGRTLAPLGCAHVGLAIGLQPSLGSSQILPNVGGLAVLVHDGIALVNARAVWTMQCNQRLNQRLDAVVSEPRVLGQPLHKRHLLTCTSERSIGQGLPRAQRLRDLRVEHVVAVRVPAKVAPGPGASLDR